MKIAVINYSGNVGKTTVARHLLVPRIPAARFIAVESVNAGTNSGQSLRGSQFRELQAYLLTVDNAIVDIGASNIEELLARMQQYSSSHEDFDCFVVPTVAPLKQQQDTIATIVDLAQIGVPREQIRIVFNMVDKGAVVEAVFSPLLAFLAERPLALADVKCRIGMNELYERIKGTGREVADIARDPTDYKAQIVQAPSLQDKLALAEHLANRRLAIGVLPEPDACFAALGLAVDGAAAIQEAA